MGINELTYKINGCAMKVHTYLGNGFQEVIYQRCLAIEFSKAGISYIREAVMEIYYNDVEVGSRRVDFIVEGIVLVELKAVINLEPVHLAQAKNYLVAYGMETGLLINFGSTSLQFKKVFNTRKNPKQDQLNHKIKANPDSDKKNST